MNEHDELIQKSILRDMSEGVMVIGLDGKIKYFNQSAVDMLEKKDTELADKSFGVLFFDDERNDNFNQIIVETIRDLSKPQYNLVQYYAPSGIKTIYVMSSFLKSEDKKIALIILLNDMTDFVSMKKRYADKLIALMDSLIQALSVAIDERSHYSANHTRNMVKIGESFLEWLDRSDHEWRFDSKKKHAFLMSIWLHDVGKLSIPLEVMDKATRLGTRLEKIENRFRNIHFLDRIAMLEGNISYEEWQLREKNRDEQLSAIRRINDSSFISDEDIAMINELSHMHYIEEDGTEVPVLTEDELSCLSIKKGTLTDEERTVMQSHVSVTKKILDRIDFPDDYLMVRDWASSHHELLNGKGYPEHKCGNDISKEVRLLTILDIYEALTAKDRPYKKPIPPDKALQILHSMAEEGSIDKELLELFERSNAWRAVVS